MKRNFLLTLVLALLCTTATWAQFAPVSGTKYALKEVTSGLFLDIQTKGIDDPNAKGSNNISLNAKPCIIYFEAGTIDGNWKLKNANNEYVCLQSGKAWNATIGNGSVQEWVILDSDTDGDFTIARTSDSKCIGMDKANIANAKPLYSDCTGEKVREFALVAYSDIIPGVYTVKTATGTYLTQTVHSTGSKATLQETAEKFKIMPSGNLFYFENNTTANKYLGTTHQWNVTDDFSLLQIVDLDAAGFAAIARAAESNKHIATNEATDKGRGIFTNVESNWNKWYFEGTYEYPTAGTVNNNKYHFTSDYITYAGGCNKIRFTLTESGANYKNGAKRLSFDSFELYDINGKKVELTAVNVTGNNIVDFSNMLDGANGTYASGVWDNANATDDWFEILLPKGVDLGGAFKFSFVTENTTMNAKKFTINTSYETPADYTVVIEAPEGENVTVTYNGEQINADDKVTSVGFDKLLVDATNISGYTWSVVVDEENETITIQYTAAQTVENPDAVVALIKRVGGESAADKFKFVLDPSMNSKNEVFVIAGEEGKVLIKGTTISAITTGIGWYLNNYAHINIAWNSLNEKTVSGAAYADLSNIPVPTGEDTRTCDATYRYYLNTCTFGYSMTSWTWKRWQQEIDWMALHGINMPLQLVGLEEVWRKFLTMEENGQRKYGYTDAEAKAFVAGPAFIAWWAMNNLEGWGGTDAGTKSGGTWDGAGGVQDDAWYARQKALAKQITDRQRELGMQPVIPGWSGMVPTNFQSKSKYTTRGNGGNWAGDFVRPLLLSVSNANYAAIAADYYKCLHEVMGESQYYSMDPFHEGGGAGTMEDYKALYAAMEAAKPGSQWVIQQWQWSATQKYSLTAVPAGRLIVLDLFSDGSPAFDGYNGYAPQDAVFCAIPNFGGRSGLMGRLNNVTDNYFKFKGKYASIKGIGTAPEAIEQTPVAYDLIYQLPWMGAKPDVAEWVENYSIARYGVANEEVQAAWELLRQGPLNYGADGIQGPVEDVWAARPNLEAYKASAWGKTLSNAMGTYNKERQLMLIDATYKLLAQNGAIAKGTVYESNYNYDIVEFGGAVMADYAYYLLTGIKEAKNASNTALYEARRDAFLALILDVDNFKGTNLNFRLGKWTQEARDAAAEAVALGATKANADWYEYNNARTIISTWSHPSTNLTDYSYRSWQGLMKDLYYPRWEYFFENNCTPERNPDAFPATPYGYFEWNWAHGMTHKVGDAGISSTPLAKGERGHTDSYTREPVGNTITEANAMLARYIIPLKTDNGTTYAYRHLTNTLSATYKVEAAEGGTIDFSKYFLADIDGATVTGDFVDGTANDITAVPVKSGIAGNTYSAAINLTDGTVINFTIVINSAEMVDAKEALATLIEKMEVLTAQVGTYQTIAEEVALQSTTQGNDYYIWCNNPHVGGDDGAGGVAALLDENAGTYLHSNWSSLSSTHDYLQIDFGNATGLNFFKIAGQQRNGGSNDRPKNIEIYGSNESDGTGWVLIATVEGLPNSQGATWESDMLFSAEKYSHLKFIVKTHDNYNQTSSVSRPYFHMAKFDLFKVSSVADVIDEYNNTELTDAFAAERYEILLAAKSVYKSATTATEIEAATTNLQAAYDELNTLVEQLKPEESKEINGVYKIKLKAYNNGTLQPAPENSYLFIAYNETPNNNWEPVVKDYKMIATKTFKADAEADMYFTITEKDGGYSLQAQGMYLKQQQDDISVQQWRHSLFSKNEDDAGVYLFEDKGSGIFAIKGKAGNVPYLNAWGEDFVIGNEEENYSTFTLTQVTEYTLTVPANGVTTLCLPFNVVLPAGVKAYDLAKANITTANRYSTYELVEVAGEGDVLAKNTPVIIKAAANDYTLTITMNDEGAKGSVENSLLRSGIVKTTLADGNNYTFDGENFNRVAAGTVIPANQCYMALDENLGGIVYGEAPVVVLTTDEENPVLYKIQINRNFDAPNASVLEYNANTGGVNVRADAADNSWQAWYFMAGNDGAVLIKPYNGDGKVLGADDSEDGHSKVWAVENGTKNVCEWTIEKYNEWYNILGNGKCFSNHSGVTYKTMGFYNDKNDNGSQFKFVEAVFTDDNARYYQLKNVKATMEAIYCGESVGLYSTESVTAYREKLNEAQALIDATSATSASADCYDAYKALRTADEALVYNAPDANKVYYIVSTASGNGREYCSGEYVRTYRKPTGRSCWAGTNTYDQTHLLFDAEGDIEQLSLAAFQFVETGTQGEYKMKNLHTGMYVKAFAGTHMGAEGDAAVVKIAGVADGQVTLKIGNNAPMHAQNDFGVIVQWNCDGGNADSPSSWTIDEVPQEDLDKLYKLTVPESGITTLNLAFNVEIPESVTVYDIVESDITKPEDSERYEFRLTEITSDGDGFVLAANTPVVIKATAGTYEFVYTADATGAIGSATGSVLKGNNYQTTPEDGTFCYVLNAEAAAFSLVEDSAAIAHNTAWMQFTEDKGTNIVSADAVEAVYPELNRVYRIKSVVTNTADEYQSHYLVNETANLAIATTAADNNSDLWVCTVADKENNEYCFVSALGTAALGWMVADEEACEFSITTGIMPGTVTLSNGTNKLALGTENYNHNGKAELFESGDDVQALNFSTDWCFEEVTDAQISFTATVRGGSSYATMYLPYAVSIPGGVAAYYAHSLNDAGNKLNLTRIESVIPKNTAVLLYRGKSNNAKANFVFSLADDVAAVANLFEGCIKQTAIPADSRVYLLLNYNSSEKFYYMADEYNADCSFVGSNGGYVKCDANKAYFKPAGAAQAVSSFGFSYSGTTAIDDLEFEVMDGSAIYDLQGRKVTEPVKGCIYIKGGKKFIAE